MLSCPLELSTQTSVYTSVIPTILMENLIDDRFSVKEMSNNLCVRKSWLSMA